MHSKLLPWDFFQKYPQTIIPDCKGNYAFLCADPYIESTLTQNLPKKENEFHCHTGADVNRDFIDEHFCNLSFFSQTENIYIIHAEQIPAQNFSFLMEKMNEIENQFVILFFSKSNKLFLDLQKLPNVNAISIEAARFWEGQKMLQLALKIKKVDLKPDHFKFLLDNLEHSFESFFRAVDLVKVSFEGNNIDLVELKKIISRERYDFFELLELYYQHPKKFFNLVLSNELDFDWLLRLANFMQGHLGKILFPAEIKLKDKPTKYELAILFQSEKLSSLTVKKDLKFFAELEIMAKGRDQLILNHLRLKIIE